MQQKINKNSKEATLQALIWIDKIDNTDDLKAIFASLIGLLAERLNRTANEYLQAVFKAAKQKGIVSNSNP